MFKEGGKVKMFFSLIIMEKTLTKGLKDLFMVPNA